MNQEIFIYKDGEMNLCLRVLLYCFFTGPILIPRINHNCLQFQFCRIQKPLLAYLGTKPSHGAWTHRQTITHSYIFFFLKIALKVL